MKGHPLKEKRKIPHLRNHPFDASNDDMQIRCTDGHQAVAFILGKSDAPDIRYDKVGPGDAGMGLRKLPPQMAPDKGGNFGGGGFSGGSEFLPE